MDERSENSPGIDDKVEKELPKVREIWLIEDQQDVRDAMARYAGMCLEEKGYSIKSFARAKEAWEEISKRVIDQLNLPSDIVIDGNLDLDEGEWRNGSHFVKQLRGLEDIKQPVIIGNSGNDNQLRELRENGADFAYDKLRGEVRDYLENPEEFIRLARERAEI